MKKLIETYEPRAKNKEKEANEKRLADWIEAVKRNKKK